MSAGSKKKIRSVARWVGWVLLIQFLLVNISASLYGYKLTYFYEPSAVQVRAPRNIFTRTWKLFTGPRFEKSKIDDVPSSNFETVHFDTRSGLTIEGWYIHADSARGTVLLVHGLGGNKSMLLKQGDEFLALGFNVLLIDLRAHGTSEGHVTTLGYSEAEEVKLACDFVASKGEKNIVLYGVSLGAAVIAKAVADYHLKPSHVIFEIPFDSQERLFAKRGKLLGFPEEPFGVLVTFWASVERGFNAFRQNTSKYAASINCPALVLSAGADEIVSPAESQAIFNSISSHNKKLVKFENVDHEFLLNRDGDKWRKEIAMFLAR